MLRLLGNLALVIGTVLGAIAAANSGRPWRELPLDADLTGQYLFDDVFLERPTVGWEPAPAQAFELGAVPVPVVFDGETAADGRALDGPGFRYRVIPRDTQLTPEVVARLRALGHERARVRKPANASEAIAVGDDPTAIHGRVLAEDVELGTKTEVLPKGRRVTLRLIRTAAAGGLGELPLEPASDRAAAGAGNTMPIPTVLPDDPDDVAAALEMVKTERDALEPLLDKPLAAEAVAVRRRPADQMDPEQAGSEPPRWPRGTRLTRELIGTLGDYAIESVSVAGKPEPLPLPELLGPDEALRAAAATELQPYLGRKLDRDLTVQVPDVAPEGRFVDTLLAERIVAAGHPSVAAANPSAFAFGDWDLRNQFLLALAIMVLGIVLKRRAGSGSGTSAIRGTSGAAVSPKELVARIERTVADLVARESELELPDLRRALDHLIEGDVADFVRGRDALRSKLGTAAFAEVFGPFSSAERRLARAWSAAVDDHVDEARDATRDALPHLEQTLANF